jgi:hypothetical protein
MRYAITEESFGPGQLTTFHGLTSYRVTAASASSPVARIPPQSSLQTTSTNQSALPDQTYAIAPAALLGLSATQP